MNYDKHYNLSGQHAFLGASKYHWINYDACKIQDVYTAYLATQRGTEIHDIARRLIENGIKLPRSQKTLNMYVNDAIGYRMVPEQILYYSDICFGTPDAISSLDSIIKTKILRIHDLKTGKVAAHMEQLLIYTALFCLEYKMKPGELTIELRIYQNDEVLYHNPTTDDILPIMDKIVTFNKIIEKRMLEEA